MASSGDSEVVARPEYQVRAATESDIPVISTINAYYVRNTVLNFRYTPATNEELLEGFRHVKQERLPYLVAIEKSSNTVLGYCYATRYRSDRLGYRPTVELSIFCSPEQLSKGIGSLLLKELLHVLRQSESHPADERSGEVENFGVRNVIACMAVDETGPSNGLALKQFYERFGFEQVGHMKAVGYKFGRWY